MEGHRMNDERMAQIERHDVGWRALARDHETRAFGATVRWSERSEDGNTAVFRGYASVFNHPYDVAGLFTETVAPGAFARTLRNEPKIHFLVNHDGIPLASTQGGTLRLREDDRGLAVLASLDLRSPLAQTVASAVERNDLSEMSFGFMVKADEWSDDYSERRITELRLFEVSVVARGANPATSAQLELAEALDADDRATVWAMSLTDRVRYIQIAEQIKQEQSVK
jgi:HK97 family phage prohead protease